ncbi:MAG TPA: hypothetical protein VFT41_06645 [Gemmatimonadaceae bacterium]|nr:hypothetical protein [Gemmatimonadaceae bacterium]
MLATAACGGASDQGVAAGPPQRLPASIAKYAGDAQVVPPGTRVPVLPTVIIRDANGLPLAGAQVDFVALDGSGVEFESPTRTDSLGLASVTSWTSSSNVGSVDSLQAEVNAANVPGNPVYFTLSIANPLPTDLVIVSGDSQVALAGQLVQGMKARLMTGNQPRPNDTLDYAATKGGGSVTGSTTVTDDAGFATIINWRLGPYPGPNELTVTARRSAAPKVTAVFHATGLMRVPARIAVWQGDGQTAAVGTPVANAPTVSVVDSTSHAVAGDTVTFRVTGGNGAIADTTVVTDVNGEASVGQWTLGPAAGANTLTASVADRGVAGNPVTFTATGTVRSSVVASVNFSWAALPVTDTVGHAIANPPVAIVRDAGGLGVAGVTVAFAPWDNYPTNGEVLEPATAVTDTSGVARITRWTLGVAPDHYCISATVGTIDATTCATALPSEPTVMQIAGGDNQTASAGTVVPVAPTVLVETAAGVPVPGVSVQFLATQGNGSVMGQAVTDSTGHASELHWTLGATPGANALTAYAVGMDSVVFHATGK